MKMQLHNVSSAKSQQHPFHIVDTTPLPLFMSAAVVFIIICLHVVLLSHPDFSAMEYEAFVAKIIRETVKPAASIIMVVCYVLTLVLPHTERFVREPVRMDVFAGLVLASFLGLFGVFLGVLHVQPRPHPSLYEQTMALRGHRPTAKPLARAVEFPVPAPSKVHFGDLSNPGIWASRFKPSVSQPQPAPVVVPAVVQTPAVIPAVVQAPVVIAPAAVHAPAPAILNPALVQAPPAIAPVVAWQPPNYVSRHFEPLPPQLLNEPVGSLRVKLWEVESFNRAYGDPLKALGQAMDTHQDPALTRLTPAEQEQMHRFRQERRVRFFYNMDVVLDVDRATGEIKKYDVVEE